MLSSKEAFLSLVRLGIGHQADTLPQTVDWQILKALAESQGLSAVVLDGIEKLPEAQRPPKVFLLEWIGETLQGYEYRYEQYRKAVAELAGFYNAHGFKMMVLKGYACSLDWLKPEHRPCGDIDIWQFGQQKEADAALAKEKGIKIDSSHHHHTVYYWGDFMVENHYDFVNVHARRSSAEMEKVFKELGKNYAHTVVVNCEKVYLPSPNLHALFLIKHLASHFVGANISLRQVLDCAFFAEKHTREIDWGWLHDKLNEFGMNDFYSIINAISVEDLGFDASIFKGVQFNPQLKEMVLSDILSPAFTSETPKSKISRVIYKYRRWKGNGWKHALCYNENRWGNFWPLLKSHVMKPEV